MFSVGVTVMMVTKVTKLKKRAGQGWRSELEVRAARNVIVIEFLCAEV